MTANPASATPTTDYYATLIHEVVHNHFALPPQPYATLQGYYRSLLQNEALRPFYRYNWQRRTAPMAQLIQALPPRQQKWRILDAGCGVGTESLFWATLRDDVAVTGVEINQERLATAQARLEKRQAATAHSLPVTFRSANIFDILEAETFDLIWTMEAISHIDPAERFLEAAFHSLESGGRLVISDSHLANPAMLWRIFKLRRQGIKQTHKVLADGRRITYAEERLFTVPQLTRLLRQAGFAEVQTQLSIFFPPRAAHYRRLFTACVMLDKAFNRLPLMRQIGGIYTVTAVKP